MILNQRIISKHDIFARITSIDIFKNYCDTFSLVGKQSSPFRNDKDPSFGFFVGESGEALFKDLASGDHGDCFDYVSRLYNLTFFETLSKIACDFNFPVDKGYFFKDMSHVRTKITELSEDERNLILASKRDVDLKIRIRKWNSNDAKFWLDRGISSKILTRYNVIPITHIFINGKIIIADDLAYAFIERKDGVETYKIYQPLNTKGLKWLSSHNSSVWQGWDQLPHKYHSLIITKSLKDVVCIVNNAVIPATSLQSENTKPKPAIIEDLKSRFEVIYVLYDNDFDKDINIGRMMGEQLAQQIGAIQIEIPDKYKCKDFSDLVLKYGKEKSLEILNSLLIPF